MMTNIFLAALPSYDNRLVITQKIHACEAKRSPLVRVQWTNINDLHITWGYIKNININDIRTVSVGMASISQFSPFMTNVEEVRLYGNAIVLRVEPYQHLLSIHKKMNHKLMEITNNLYQFHVKGRFDPHLTIGRLRNVQLLNPLHRQQFLQLVQEQFRGYSFLIQQATLLRRFREGDHEGGSSYETIHLYSLR